MISKSVKAKRRHQAREAAIIKDVLLGKVDYDAADAEVDGYLTCDALNVREGLNDIPGTAEFIARFPRGSSARADAAFYCGGNAALTAALGYKTPMFVLEEAGLL